MDPIIIYKFVKAIPWRPSYTFLYNYFLVFMVFKYIMIPIFASS